MRLSAAQIIILAQEYEEQEAMHQYDVEEGWIQELCNEDAGDR